LRRFFSKKRLLPCLQHSPDHGYDLYACRPADGLGLFFVGVRALSANLVRAPLGTAASGILAGLLTQSSTAVY
jgi:hypothetical protein